jgi:KaiC/GvpD/RAD55 family RecA-like ATPase
MKKKDLDYKEMELAILYEELRDIMLDNVLKCNDAQVVASTMVSLAFRLYKTVLTDGDYKDMLKAVINNAKKTEPFVFRELH